MVPTANTHRVLLAVNVNGVWVQDFAKALQQLHLCVAQCVLVCVVEALQLLALGLDKLCPVVRGLGTLLPPAQ
jgi:hypothetical protein